MDSEHEICLDRCLHRAVRHDLSSHTCHVNETSPAPPAPFRQYSITVTASDGKFEATQTVQIEVMNVNDVAPVFDQPGYELRLREGYISPEPIIKVRRAQYSSSVLGITY